MTWRETKEATAASIYIHDNGVLHLIGTYRWSHDVLTVHEPESAVAETEVFLKTVVAKTADAQGHTLKETNDEDPEHSLHLFRAGRWDRYWLDRRRPCPWTMHTDHVEVEEETHLPIERKKESTGTIGGKESLRLAMRPDQSTSPRSGTP